ncbi:hypothetical protein LEP3755_14410 [Leptolyngbya sp. NIES-3755]|nr:hypothetical protein LEP3755_14410 [Leptolyngbya sp. NIES-3755]
MPEPASFSYIPPNATERQRSGLPYLPITLRYRGRAITANALLDTGAIVNVIPYELGIQLGIVWEEQIPAPQLAGNLAEAESRGVLITGLVQEFPPVRLGFVWTRNNSAPLILGQLNFFQEFQICFDGSNQVFTLISKH